MNYRLSLVTLCMLLSGCQLSQTPVLSEQTPQPDSLQPAGMPADGAVRLADAASSNDRTVSASPVLTASSSSAPEPARPEAIGPEHYDDLWQQLAADFTWQVPDNARVEAQRKFYLRHKTYLKTVSKRAEPFLYLITEQLRQDGLPPELALLPIVESSFDQFAYSHGRAAGLWQFIPETGSKFGLEQNWWYDGRRDVLASTEAASRFLQYLNRRFDGDWLLALAAYNSGEGRVLNAMRANRKQGKPTDFWALDLPKETRSYVPKMLALIDLIQQPERFNTNLLPIANEPAVRPVTINQQIDLALAAELAGISLKQLQQLNPGHNRWATAPDMTQRILLPLQAADTFEQQLASTPSDRLIQWERYRIQSGDNLGSIAQQFGTTVNVVKQANQLDSNVIRAGQYLMIPRATQSLEDYPLTASSRLASLQNSASKRAKISYEVRSGDSLWEIGKTYKVSPQSLARWNGFAPSEPIRPGQKLVIWLDKASDNQAKDAILRQVSYQVRKGDSLWLIANRFSVSVTDIKRWNQLGSKKYLQPGQSLKLFVDVTRI